MTVILANAIRTNIASQNAVTLETLGLLNPPQYIFLSLSLMIINKSPKCFVAVGQHGMVIITSKKVPVIVWVHYDN